MKRKAISLTVILILLFNLMPGALAEADSANPTIREVGVSGTPHNMFDMYSLKGNALYPEYYSSVDMGLTPGIKNQQSTELCWAFTQNNLLEINVKKNTGMDVDYSEQAMKFETSNSTDLINGFRRGPNDGGNETMSIAYLARTGSVLESDEPFSVSTVRTAGNPARHGYLKNAPMCVYDTIGYNEQSIIKIKQLVTEYGAAGAGMYFSSSYENSNKENYYYPVTGASGSSNHEVTIVGWDDNYSAAKFSEKPAGNGAFIIKNSYGMCHRNGTSDLCYVSYYDKFICSEVFTSEYEPENKLFDNVYSYDDGWSVSIGFNGYESAYYGMKFTAGSGTELLTAVGTYIAEPNVNAHVMINTTSLDIHDEDAYRTVFSKYYKDPGYYTMEFEPISLSEGDFFVVIKIDSPKNYPTFPVQYYDTGDSKIMVCAQNIPDTSFAGVQISNMKALEKSFPDNRIMGCIKAYTMQNDGPVRFRDVPDSSWYKDAVDFVSYRKIMSGVGGSMFRPNGVLTRAQFAQILANMSDSFSANEYTDAVFNDVKPGSWYFPAVSWAYSKGIVSGVSHAKFDPDAAITRQQMCVMLIRYTDICGIALNTDVSVSKFDDDADIQSYAKAAVYKCKKAGIISGVSPTEFRPLGGATRAQIAMVLTNFYQKCI